MFNEISSELITSTKDDLITTGNVNYKINIRALGIISTVLQLPLEDNNISNINGPWGYWLH
ncbi:uncharacterized protein LOC120778936 isoform X2 [Bactrocera tryoni]|uniref:uncharacterized protein LOC120778936 isoform X2 n=1 Tax=Bactrocera tryoni TaxID=59916 RepID=UPI001A9996FC|nr:uncharacterized protein LOC120778936 isoform X2 [Bactrocera tryoni]